MDSREGSLNGSEREDARSARWCGTQRFGEKDQVAFLTGEFSDFFRPSDESLPQGGSKEGCEAQLVGESLGEFSPGMKGFGGLIRLITAKKKACLAVGAPESPLDVAFTKMAIG